MKLNIKNIACFALLVGLFGVSSLQAQNKKGKKVATLTIATTIVDDEFEPIEGAEMITREGAVSNFSDASGSVEVKALANGVILVEAFGYEDVVIDLSEGETVPAQLVMTKSGILASSKDIIARGDNSTQKLAHYTGAASTVKGADLTSYPDYTLSNTLQGRLAGAVVSSTTNNHGNNIANIFVRGLKRDDSNGALYIVDGMERSYDDILPEEVESITILKDAMGKILYGSRAANGVVVITTKRGALHKRVANFNVQRGVSMATRSAEYLDSYEYATLFNEARENDGMKPYYSAKDVEGYKNSTGANDLYHPNVDYSDYFLDNTVNFTKASLDMAGGNDKVQYAVVAAYLGGNGYESTGSSSTINRIGARGNLSIKITDAISFVANSAVRYENRDYGSLDGQNIYARVSTYRPNEMPLTIDPALIGELPAKDGTPFFGASTRLTSNLLADTEYGGKTREYYISSQTNLGLRFDLSDYVKGLSVGGDFMFDNYEYFRLGHTNTYATYALVGTAGDGAPIMQQVRNESLSSADSREGFNSQRTTAWRMMANYTRSFGDHDVDAAMTHNSYFLEGWGMNQNVVNSNTTLRATYTYDDTYTLEGSLALLGSNRYNKNNRYFLSRAFGASWILSNEEFLKDCSLVDFLKVKASYGVLGYDAATSYILHQQTYGNAGTTQFGSANSSNVDAIDLVRVASDIDWEYSREYNVGAEAYMFDGRLRAELNYFHETRNDMVSGVKYRVAGVVGDLIEQDNVGKVRNQGVDGDIEWSGRKGDFSYTAGVNFLFSKNKILDWNEVAYANQNLSTIGQSTSAMYGYVALGLFGKDVEMEGHPTQLLGDYQEGDIAYKDINNDGVIDQNDRCVIGDSHPTGSLGIDLNLGYKGWGLYLLGTAETGINTWLNNSYYWVDGLDKYSDIVKDRWHAENNPDGFYPRLTTLSADNNFVNSTCWMASAAFFRLKNAQFSYTFDFNSPTSFVDKVKLFVNATNLCVFSSIKELDPEVLNSGVTNYPLSRTITGGVSVTF